MKIFRNAILVAAFLTSMLAPVFAQNVMNGTWSIQPGGNAGEIQLELRYSSARGADRSQNSHDFNVQTLGLRPEDISGPSHPVHFSLSRDAGTIDFTGTAGEGVGAGHYKFAPNRSYPQAIAARGMDRPDLEKQLVAVMLDISLSYADGVIAAGVRPSSFDKLIAFRALRITPESITSLRRAFGAMDEEQLITFSALHITPRYAAEMRAEGLTGLDSQSLVTLKALHVDAAYIHDLGSAGYSHLSANELTELKALHVDAQYIRRVESHGYKHPTVQQLVQMKAMKII